MLQDYAFHFAGNISTTEGKFRHSLVQPTCRVGLFQCGELRPQPAQKDAARSGFCGVASGCTARIRKIIAVAGGISSQNQYEVSKPCLMPGICPFNVFGQETLCLISTLTLSLVVSSALCELVSNGAKLRIVNISELFQGSLQCRGNQRPIRLQGRNRQQQLLESN